MNHEKSCGAVLFTRQEGRILYLLVQNYTGIYGFPKGHVESGEEEVQTALREIREETGLTATLLPGFRREEEYALAANPDTRKTVVYYLGEFHEQAVSYQKEELMDAILVDLDTALSRLQFASRRQILCDAHTFLTGHPR